MALENYYSEHEGKTIDRVVREAGVHMVDNVKHITQAERESWNSKASNQDFSNFTQTVNQRLSAYDTKIENEIGNVMNEVNNKVGSDEIDSIKPLMDTGSYDTNAIIASTVGLRTLIWGYSNVMTETNEIYLTVSAGDQIMIEGDSLQGDYDYVLGYSEGSGNRYKFGEWVTISRESEEIYVGAIGISPSGRPPYKDVKIRLKKAASDGLSDIERNTIKAFTCGYRTKLYKYGQAGATYVLPLTLLGDERFMIKRISGTFPDNDDYEYWDGNESFAGSFGSWYDYKGRDGDTLSVGLYSNEPTAEVVIYLKRT